MATLSFAFVVCIFLLVKGTEAQTAGERCTTPDDAPCGSNASFICQQGTCKANTGVPCNTTMPCVSRATCEDGTCKIKVDGYCFSGLPEPNCIAHAECLDNKCLCEKDFTSNKDNTVCEVKAETTGCGNTGPCASDATCEGGICKTKQSNPSELCSVASNAACDPTTLACQNDKCKRKIGGDCSAASDCVTGADCSADKCSCTGGVAASEDNTKCGGAMGVAASMLLVVATFVTSRFL